jgi:hypothetical protein
VVDLTSLQRRHYKLRACSCSRSRSDLSAVCHLSAVGRIEWFLAGRRSVTVQRIVFVVLSYSQPAGSVWHIRFQEIVLPILSFVHLTDDLVAGRVPALLAL